MFLKNKVKMLI